MFTKVYWVLWALLGFITLGLVVAGSLTWFSVSVVGFTACLLIFTGMMCVTISIVGPHAKEYQHGDAEPQPKKDRVKEAAPRHIAAPAVAVQSRHAH